MINLTKDADKMICCIYKSFLQKRKEGIPRAAARRFKKEYFANDNYFSSCVNPADVQDTLLELKRADFIKQSVTGNVDLTDAGIIYMENRFKNGLTDVVDFISKLIP